MFMWNKVDIRCGLRGINGKVIRNYATAVEAADNKVGRLQVLTNFLPFNIYFRIDDCETYEAAIQNVCLHAICWLQQNRNLANV